jgi:hypothetical protein
MDVQDDITAYEALQSQLERGKWVVFHDKKHVGTYDSFETAANDAVKRFGKGPYLIRQVGAGLFFKTAPWFTMGEQAPW